MKYLFLFLVPIYYIIRMMPILFEHSKLFNGLLILVLTATTGIFFTGWFISFKSEMRLRKKLGEKTYNWLESEV